MPAFRARTFGDLVDEFAERQPDAFFGVDSGGDRASYVEFAAQSGAVAGWLAANGVRRGSRVGLLMSNRLDWLRLATGAHKLGATVVPMSTWSTAREIAFVLRDADIGLIVAEAAVRSNDFRAVFSNLDAGLPGMRALFFWNDVRDDALATAFAPPAAPVRAASPAFILYTSGSTAAPKGVLLTHGDSIENAFNIGERMHLGREDRVYLAVPLFWSFGSINAWPALLTHGAGFVLQATFDAARGLDLIEREHCTVFYGMINMAKALAEHSSFTPARTAALRTGLTIGSFEDLQYVADVLGAKEICNVYGMTETYGNCCVTDASLPRELRFRTQGAPLPEVEVRIAGDDGRPLPPGHLGDIEVRGYTALYTNRELTADAYAADGFFRTGDVGAMQTDGFVQFRARSHEMIKTGGINVAPAEVEEILRAHPGVDQAYVVGVPDRVRGEFVFAYVTAAGALDPGAILAHCRAHLASYKVPVRVEVLSADQIPFTATGKVQKRRLRERAATQAATPVR